MHVNTALNLTLNWTFVAEQTGIKKICVFALVFYGEQWQHTDAATMCCAAKAHTRLEWLAFWMSIFRIEEQNQTFTV